MLAHRVPVAVRSQLARILAVDGFLQSFRAKLLSTWTTVVEEYASDLPVRWRHLLKEAVMLRDCSFIVGLTPGTLQHQIHLIDLDHKHDEKMDYYVSEVRLMRDLLRKN